MLLPRAAYARAGLSNRFCPSVIVVVVCHQKKLQMGDLEAVTISKQKINAEIYGAPSVSKLPIDLHIYMDCSVYKCHAP